MDEHGPWRERRAGRRRCPSGGEHGFTLIEALVAVVVIGVLLAIAIPTFLGSKERASDVRAKAQAKLALTAQKAYFADHLRYGGAAVIHEQEPGLPAEDGHTAVLGKVVVRTDPANPSTVTLVAQSDSGTCFWVRDTGGHSEFATDDCSVPFEELDWNRSW